VDPTEGESGAARGSLTLSCMPALSAVTSVWQKGTASVEEVLQVHLSLA
jgi:exosome complex component MTR3